MSTNLAKAEPEGAAALDPGPAPASLWSNEAALLVRPFSTYRALATQRGERTRRDLGRALLLQSVLLGAFVSLTTAGRLVASHIVFTALFWGFLPLLQTFAVALALRAAAPSEPLVPALSLYLEGLGPYYVFYLVLSGICLFAPNVYDAFTALLRAWVLLIFFIGTIVWGIVLTIAFFRAGLGLSFGRTGRALAVFYAVFVGVVVGWYLAMNEIQPQVVGT